MPFQGRVKISQRTTLALKFVELFLKGGSLFAHFLCVGTHAKRPLSRVKPKSFQGHKQLNVMSETLYQEWTFISAALGRLLPLLSGRQGPLVKPFNHRLRSPHPTLPGNNSQAYFLTHTPITPWPQPLFQGSTLLSEGISSRRHPAYLGYRKTVPRSAIHAFCYFSDQRVTFNLQVFGELLATGSVLPCSATGV